LLLYTEIHKQMHDKPRKQYMKRQRRSYRLFRIRCSVSSNTSTTADESLDPHIIHKQATQPKQQPYLWRF
jgi:hypothetical protein